MAKPFSQLMMQMTPESRARVERGVMEAKEQMLLVELSRLTNQPAEKLARKLGLHWPLEFPIDEYDRLPLDMMLNIITDLGGEIAIDLKLPQGALRVERPEIPVKHRRSA